MAGLSASTGPEVKSYGFDRQSGHTPDALQSQDGGMEFSTELAAVKYNRPSHLTTNGLSDLHKREGRPAEVPVLAQYNTGADVWFS